MSGFGTREGKGRERKRGRNNLKGSIIFVDLNEMRWRKGVRKGNKRARSEVKWGKKTRADKDCIYAQTFFFSVYM